MAQVNVWNTERSEKTEYSLSFAEILDEGDAGVFIAHPNVSAVIFQEKAREIAPLGGANSKHLVLKNIYVHIY